MDQEEDENESFYVNMAPSCFMQRERSEKNFNRESSMEHLLTELAKELAQTLKQTKGGIGLLPKTIANVLNSQACRGMLSIIPHFSYYRLIIMRSLENFSTSAIT